MEPIKLSGRMVTVREGEVYDVNHTQEDGVTWATLLDRVGSDLDALRQLIVKPHGVAILNAAREDSGVDTTADTSDLRATIAAVDALRAAWQGVEAAAYRD